MGYMYSRRSRTMYICHRAGNRSSHTAITQRDARGAVLGRLVPLDQRYSLLTQRLERTLYDRQIVHVP
jgi:hypothetical protein